jgi:hypothetical protein
MNSLTHTATGLAKSALGMSGRRKIALTRVKLRRPSATLRRLPDFLVIGGQRCGTSSLYKYLGGHPSIAPSIRKEVEYFSRNYGRGENWYRAHFPLRARRCATFESTPDYLYHPLTAARVREDLPNARFVVLLREPIARALSHHQHMTRLGFETESFERSLDLEDSRVRPDLHRLHREPLHDVRFALRFSYAGRGMYASQLQRWFDVFPRDRFLVVFAEDLFANPAPTFDRILAFLDLPMFRPSSFRNHSAPHASERDRISGATRERLASVFEGPNRDLAEVLGVRLPWETS